MRLHQVLEQQEIQQYRQAGLTWSQIRQIALRKQRSKYNTWWTWAAAALVVLLLVGGGAWFFLRLWTGGNGSEVATTATPVAVAPIVETATVIPTTPSITPTLEPTATSVNA